jgi:hypothetical protein
VILGLMVLGSGGGARCADDDGGVTGASPMIVVISNSTFLDSLVKLTCPMSLQDYVSEGVRKVKIRRCIEVGEHKRSHTLLKSKIERVKVG